MAKRKIDMLGKTCGRLKVIAEYGRTSSGAVTWLCQCSCPKKSYCVVVGTDLRKHKVVSCGCYRREQSLKRIKALTADGANTARIKTDKLNARNTSGIKGVRQDKDGKWKAYIGYQNRSIHLGTFSTAEEAIGARKRAEEKISRKESPR